MVDIETVVMDLLDDLGDTVSVTPGDLAARITAGKGVIRVRRVGGGADRDSDNPTVSLQCFAGRTQAHPRAAHDLEAAVWGRFLAILEGDHSGWVPSGLIEDPSKTSGPVELPYPDPTIAVVESLIRLTRRT